MSAIGIDFGNESCFVAAGLAGGIETLANDYSLRATPACVAFAGKKRVIGVAAKNQQVTNMKNTICDFKRLLGRKFADPQVQNELQYIPYRVEALPDGGVGVRVNYLDKEHVFLPQQLTAMLFTKLKETSETALQGQVNDCVIACPIFFTNAERKALMDAAKIADLNVLRLINETTAIALSYGFYKQDLPPVDEKPRNIIFVDFGNASLQVSAVAFNTGKLKMICSAWDQIGGRDFDAILANWFSDDFQAKYKINAKTNPRAYLRLLSEVEKIKKQMSANSTKLPLNIECFMEEIDVHSSMSRAEMEELCGHLLERIEKTFVKCLQDSKLTIEEIYSVEVVGGSTRIPAVKALIEKVFNKQACTTLNQDEAVSRGAALQCAILSPKVRARDFSVVDIQNYSVNVSWDGEGTQNGEMEVFSQFHAAPFSRLLTLYRRGPFNIQISYADQNTFPDPVIGRWRVNDIKPNAAGESQEIKVKVRIDHNGIIFVANATMIDKKIALEAENANNEQQDASGEQMDTQEGTNDDPKNKEKKKKSPSKQTELTIDAYTHGYSHDELMNYHEEETRMIQNDQQEKERVDARNALEEFIYDMRDKLAEEGPLSCYVVEDDRVNICSQLNELENWLYEEGEDCERDTYRSKLSNLHSLTDPIKARSVEYEYQPRDFDDLGHCIQMARKAVGEYREGSQKYNHLTETEILNLTESADKAQKWHEEQIGKFQRASKTVDLPVKSSEIRHEIHTLSQCINSVLNRPKPKPPTPPIDPQPTENKRNKEETPAEPTLSEDKMDVE